MDVAMPDLNGLVASRRVISASPRTKVLALSMRAGKTFVEGMLRAGARGYVLKDCAFEELARRIRWRVKIENQSSTRFIQDAEVGVKWR